MSAIAQYLADALLNHLARDTAFSKPTTTEIRLYLSDGNEVSTVGTGYARKTVNIDGATSPFWTAPADHASGRSVENDSLIEYDEATAHWGGGGELSVTEVGILDESDNVLFRDELTQPEEVSTGRVFRFKAGDLKWVFETYEAAA